jgi:hypothetical protein
VNAQELKLPVASATQDVATLLPSNVTAMVLFGAKPLPLTPAVPPTAPALGLRLMAGVTVYVATAEFGKVAQAAFRLLPDAVTVWVPADAGGTANAQELKRPFASVVQNAGTLAPSTVTAMVSFGAKPLPLTVALLPTAPALALRLMAGVTV